EVPDPQDPATFERSELTWAGDGALRDLYARLLRARRDLRGEAEAEFDEEERRLIVRRGEHVLACNFAPQPKAMALPCSSIVLATHDGTELRDGSVMLPPLAGALLR